MKLQTLGDPNINTITGYGPGYLEINRIRLAGSVLLQSRGEPQSWPVDDWQTLTETHFEAILSLAPELVLLGTGRRQHFTHPRHYARLTAARIGVEMMDTGAACRTFNILVTEGRQVLAALIPPSA